MEPVLVPRGVPPERVGEAGGIGRDEVGHVEDRSFEAFYERERDHAMRTAWLITGDGDVARELTQEAFARAYARWARIARYDRPGAWLRRVVVRLAVRHRDRRGREVASLAATEDAAGERGPLGHRDPVEVERVDVAGALALLPPQQRAVVVLHYLYDLPVTAVALELGVGEGSVKTQLHRARVRLGPLLEVDDGR